jgi:hypothetical protein
MGAIWRAAPAGARAAHFGGARAGQSPGHTTQSAGRPALQCTARASGDSPAHDR